MISSNSAWRIVSSLAVGFLIAGAPARSVRAGAPLQAPKSGDGNHENAPVPGTDCVDRIDFDVLHVGAVAQAGFGVTFWGIQDPGLSLKIDVPQFVAVKHMQLFRRGEDQPGAMYCSIAIEIDTKSVGKRTGNINVRLGVQEVSIPVAAAIAPQELGQTKVLVVSSGFGGVSLHADYYRPWFDLVREAKLDVSYVEGLEFRSIFRPRLGPEAIDPLPDELSQYDVILLSDDGAEYLTKQTSLMLMQFADLGKRVIITATPASSNTVLFANRMLDSLGMHMMDREIVVRPIDRDQGMGIFEAVRLESDDLLEGVKKLSTFRPAPIHAQDPAKATILAYLPNIEDGFAAVSRQANGEIVALGVALLPEWIGKRGEGTDNARFLKNLLTKKNAR